MNDRHDLKTPEESWQVPVASTVVAPCRGLPARTKFDLVFDVALLITLGISFPRTSPGLPLGLSPVHDAR
jgi:hypothetical protein